MTSERDRSGPVIATAPAARGHASRARLGDGPIGAAIGRVTRVLAMVGGVLLLIAVAITLASVVGRYALAAPVPGDYELVELICAVGIFLFFPYTHAVNGNITAEFFTLGLSERKRRVLDVAHDIVFVAVGVLLTWRMSHGLADKFASGDASILIRIPLWWPFSVAVISIALLTLVCVWRVIVGIGSLRR